MNLWKRKLAAYLHDPPEKAYDYSSEHGKRAQHYAGRLGISLSEWKDKLPDHTAAAADRFIFPSTKRKDGDRWVDTGVPGLGGGLQFIHPLSGHLVAQAGDFPTEDEALGFCRDGFPDFSGITDDELRFRLVWRLWRQFTLEQPRTRKHAFGLSCLPADTRIPDGTIWHHDSIVSALESARDKEGRIAPAFLLFQLGPVQDFISQARSTRDLWSGSYLLSWMMAHVLRVVTERFGPDAIVFPSLRGQPLYDWLDKSRLQQAFHTSADGAKSQNFWVTSGYASPGGQELVLTPTLPNRFLAVVPANFDPSILTTVFDTDRPDSEWSRIAGACWEFLSIAPLSSGAQGLWKEQLRRFWQPSWQLWPWQPIQPALDRFRQTPLGKDSTLRLAREVALAIPHEHKDTRCYTDDRREIENAGWAWSAHYQLLQHRLDARRRTREFAAWHSAPPTPKDYFTGREEVIANREWLERAREQGELRHLFRNNEELGAVNLIKRVWHKAYLEKLQNFHPELANLRRARESFDSVPAVAARPFAEWLRKETTSGRLRGPFLAFMQAASDAREDFPDNIARWENNEVDWLRDTDASAFHLGAWDQALGPDGTLDARARQRLVEARKALDALLERAGVQPARYYAVLALDGDEMGKWLSGEKAPVISKVLTQKASEYFRKTFENWKSSDQRTVRDWLESHRPLSPSYHLQFSEALANFALYCARRIVEAHHGQLIYSGGDDVLAMLPASEAIACAQALRFAFQGRSKELTAHAEGRHLPAFQPDAPEGFIHLKDGESDRGGRRPVDPCWPLMVPGPAATVSVGLAIGHIKEPLQDMVREAQVAEARAKTKLDRNSIAVTLFKRSGETVEWGTRFTDEKGKSSAALQLLDFIQTENRYRRPLDQPDFEPPISAKLPYRVAELLRRYQNYPTRDGRPDPSNPEPLNAEVRQLALREFEWVIQQQAEKLQKDDKEKLACLAGRCLEELEHRQRPLQDFINLFALEAFIARTGE